MTLPPGRPAEPDDPRFVAGRTHRLPEHEPSRRETFEEARHPARSALGRLVRAIRWLGNRRTGPLPRLRRVGGVVRDAVREPDRLRRLPAGPTGSAAEPGADPAVDRVLPPPDALRDAVSVRTIDDVRNWWRTLGIALVAGPPDGTAVREAMASGAVPVVPTDPGAVAAVRRLADPATWRLESNAARSAALSGVCG